MAGVVRPAALVLLAAALSGPAHALSPPAFVVELATTLYHAGRHAAAALLPPPAPPLVDPRAVTLIVHFEIGSEALYARRYRMPIYPGGASGPTIGVGYDLGHQSAERILDDWSAHPARARLASGAGVLREAAQAWVRTNGDIDTPYPLAAQVFGEATLPRYKRSAEQAFGRGFVAADSAVQGALTSVVFNRGSGMKGQSRREMRAIRDACLPDKRCTAEQIRAMCRIWRGTQLEHGLCRRREAEASLAEEP